MGFFFKLSPVLLMIILILNLIIEIFVTEQASYISKKSISCNRSMCFNYINLREYPIDSGNFRIFLYLQYE